MVDVYTAIYNVYHYYFVYYNNLTYQFPHDANMRIKLGNNAEYYWGKCIEIERNAKSLDLWIWSVNSYDERFNWENTSVS
ncbi:MAG: hypothetical protein GX941_01390 [Candidatus Methanofastidiosa archaeon]|nr:hypothetical protein [Candidatus Methanofastidiosa archaeon]